MQGIETHLIPLIIQNCEIGNEVSNREPRQDRQDQKETTYKHPLCLNEDHLERGKGEANKED